jgi:hypothetical protein
VLARAASQSSLGLLGQWTPATVGPWAARAQGVASTLGQRGITPQLERTARWLPPGCVVRWLEQRQRVEIESAGDALQALERQVALASLDAAHVGAVDAENIGKRLLAESFGFSIGAQGSANGAL